MYLSVQSSTHIHTPFTSLLAKLNILNDMLLTIYTKHKARDIETCSIWFFRSPFSYYFFLQGFHFYRFLLLVSFALFVIHIK